MFYTNCLVNHHFLTVISSFYFEGCHSIFFLTSLSFIIDRHFWDLIKFSCIFGSFSFIDPLIINLNRYFVLFTLCTPFPPLFFLFHLFWKEILFPVQFAFRKDHFSIQRNHLLCSNCLRLSSFWLFSICCIFFPSKRNYCAKLLEMWKIFIKSTRKLLLL